jgi:hypothetical protein
MKDESHTKREVSFFALGSGKTGGRTEDEEIWRGFDMG